MYIRIATYFIFALLLLRGDFFSKSVFAQQLDPALDAKALDPANAGAIAGSVSPSLGKSTSPRRDFHWVPTEVDDSIPQVEPDSACNLDEFLEKAGARIQEFVKNVERFTATESLLHESFNKAGKISWKQQRTYDYVVSIEEIRPKILDVEEFLRSSSSSLDPPGGIAMKGLPALVLIFHPYYSETFSMRCEGLTTFNGKPAWQIYFRQRKDQPNRVRSYRIGWSGPAHPVALKGRAWFAADSYQIEGLQTDLIDSIPDIQLAVDHTLIEYGPVHFGSRDVDIWLPQNAEAYCDLRGKRIHQRMNFSNYLLFAVDDTQSISAPKISP